MPPPPEVAVGQQKWKNAWLQNMIETLVVSFQSSETRQWFQVFLVDPVVSYIMERCFPYFIIFAAIFIILVLFLIVILFIVIRNGRHICPHCG
jgi:hypothetical protein